MLVAAFKKAIFAEFNEFIEAHMIVLSKFVRNYFFNGKTEFKTGKLLAELNLNLSVKYFFLKSYISLVFNENYVNQLAREKKVSSSVMHVYVSRKKLFT